jgi:hypothetical protein
MNHNVLQYETVGFSERVPVHRWKKLMREPKPRKALNPNFFILCVMHLLIFHLNLQAPIPIRDGFIGWEFINENSAVAICFNDSCTI